MSTYKKTSLLDDFDLPEVTFENIKAQLVKVSKISTVKKKTKWEDLPLEDKLRLVEKDVYKALGKYKNFVRVIRDIGELNKYVDKVIKANILAFDTETNNSLDPLTAKIMGACFYIPNSRPVYVPINHCEPGTDIRLSNQITEEQLKEVLLRLKNVKIIMHNGKFDIRVIFNIFGFYLPIWWDTMLGAQLINENELAGLKPQFKNNVDPTANVYNIETLFRGLPYAWISVDIFAIYAAIDAYDTYLLYKVQEKFFSQPENQKLLKLFLEIEVPTSMVVAKMEDDGISVDDEFAAKLHNKYMTKLNYYKDKLDEMLKEYSEDITSYQAQGLLENPVNFNSFAQLQILLYDIMKHPILSESGKATDEDTLKLLGSDFTKTLLNYRHYAKQTSSFTESLIKFKSVKDGKIHANFHQMGKEEKNVKTGRFSSTGPNLQQIPSDGTVRLMFKGSDEYFHKNVEHEIMFKDYNEVKTPFGWKYCLDLVDGDNIIINHKNGIEDIYLKVKKVESLPRHFIKVNFDLEKDFDYSNYSIYCRTIYIIIGADYSQQEPRILTHMCQDEKLIETYNSNRDLYAFIASSIFKRDYWECRETHKDGTPNEEGKRIRKQAKSIVLGTMYGMGPKTLAANLKVSVDECKDILNEFFEIFPTVKDFIASNEKSARENGYVEDYLGRRRHLPDINLPELDIKATKKKLIDNIFVEDVPEILEVYDEELTNKWYNILKTTMSSKGNRFKLKKKFIEKAKESGIDVRDNGAFISKTLTQCTNARIQGGASSLTKKAMVMIYRDDRLNDMETRLLVPVHDELMAEAPKLHALKAVEYFAEDMIKAGIPECSVSMAVDTYVCKNWNLIEVYNEIRDKFYILTTPKDGRKAISEEEALKNILEEYEEISPEAVKQMCYGTFDVINGEI